MGPREVAIREYFLYKIERLKKKNIYLDKEQINKAVDKYASKPWNMRDIEKQIDKDIEEILANNEILNQLREETIKKIDANKEISDLPLEYTGIEISNETADMMKIKDASTPEELKENINEASKTSPTLDDLKYTDKQILNAKSEIFKTYQDTEIDKNDYQKDSSTMIKKKMEYLKDKGEVTEKETEKVDEIVEKSSTTDQVINKVRNNFEENDAHDIYETINEDTPIEESGIKQTTNNPNINPFDNKEDQLNDMFVEKQPPKEVKETSKEKPKTYIKTEIPNEGTESGFVSLVLISISILIVMAIIIGTLLVITS